MELTGKVLANVHKTVGSFLYTTTQKLKMYNLKNSGDGHSSTHLIPFNHLRDRGRKISEFKPTWSTQRVPGQTRDTQRNSVSKKLKLPLPTKTRTTKPPQIL